MLAIFLHIKPQYLVYIPFHTCHGKDTMKKQLEKILVKKKTVLLFCMFMWWMKMAKSLYVFWQPHTMSTGRLWDMFLYPLLGFWLPILMFNHKITDFWLGQFVVSQSHRIPVTIVKIDSYIFYCICMNYISMNTQCCRIGPNRFGRGWLAMVWMFATNAILIGEALQDGPVWRWACDGTPWKFRLDRFV